MLTSVASPPLTIERLKFNPKWALMKELSPVFRFRGSKKITNQKTPMRLKRKYLAGSYLKTKKLETPYSAVQCIQYRLLGLNKAYLTSLAPFHTWNYTLPDYIVGSFIRMFFGVFMQRGNLVTMLNFFEQVKSLAEVVPVAHNSYKVIYPSFPSVLEPRITRHTEPHSIISGAAQLRVLVKTQTQRGGPIKVKGPKKMGLGLLGLRAFRAGGPKKAQSQSYGLKFRQRRSFRFIRVTGTLSRLNKQNKLSKKQRLFFLAKPDIKGPQANMLAVHFKNPKSGSRLPNQNNLAFWNLLYQQPLLNYSLKYCRLSRRVRKILKNKYRYSKYYFIIAPYKRRLFTLHLWKYILKFHDERTFFLRLASLLKNFTSPDSDSLLWSLFYTQQRLALKKLLGR